jgi:hypothetical protein
MCLQPLLHARDGPSKLSKAMTRPIETDQCDVARGLEQQAKIIAADQGVAASPQLGDSLRGLGIAPFRDELEESVGGSPVNQGGSVTRTLPS